MTHLASRRPTPAAHTTIRRYLAALNTAHEVVGLTAPTRGHASHSTRVERVYKGIKREQGSTSKRVRRPITTSLLRQMLPLLDLSQHTDRLVWAAMCTATCGLLRLGEVTVKSHYAARRTLRLQDLIFTCTSGLLVPAFTSPHTINAIPVSDIDHASLFVPASKTDPFSKGIKVIISSPLALHALHGLLSSHNVPAPASATQSARDPSSPLFSHADGAALQSSTVINTTRALLAGLHLNPAEYAGHSFRKGGATSLAAIGTPDHIIQTMGRWSSDSYRLYIELPIQHLIHASQHM
jgi:hypothetical protein